ncbi:MAG: cadherin repeat domain-containing protein [Candidatus Pseudobacter hemicellulosilyticus]|uniref:Cadherin repeat domain-containing protein n=1 Tax=Candidatus Pseudobacter hemicellulosilyticus TaxID=3121375 RepID=A0AAJ6BHV1_9BACT|nr:MAG: cadherin repeat domain-containing protein [Pseudobacter sp.]
MRTIATALLVLLATALLAQQPEHTYQLGGKIESMTLTESGVLIVVGGGGLAGIKAGEQQPHFNFTEYGKVKEEELEYVPASPYLIVNQGGMFSQKKTVIDYVAGRQLFATEENGWKILTGLHVLLPQNKLVVYGTRSQKAGGASAVGLYDLESGKEEKVFALNDPKRVGLASAIPIASGKPLIVGTNLLVPTSKNTLCIDMASGNILWTAKADKLSWMSVDRSGKEIYGFEERPNGDTRIHKISVTGEMLWADERKIKGKLTRFEILPKGLAVVSDVDNSDKKGIAKLASAASESRIAFLSAADGSDLWDKAPKTKGYVQHFYIMDDGILFGIASGGINKISFDGQTLFRKPLSTGENIHTMANTPKGLIYITDTDANIVDLKSGESIWNKPIKYKKAAAVASAYDAGHQRYLISTGNELLAINENTGDISTLANMKFEEKEVPYKLQVRKEGLLLSSDQNLLMLDFNGGRKFHEYYKSPGQSTFVKIATGVLAVAGTAMSSAAAYQGGLYGHHGYSNQLNDYGKEMKIYQDGFADIASASFKEMNKRFKATAATENAQFILTKLDGGVGLVKLNKDDGKNQREIVLKDKKPVYQVDEFGGMLYYQSGSGEIAAYRL